MRADEVYRPKRRLIDDVRESPSYYHASDVAVSPFTPIGQIAHAIPEEGSVPIKVRRKPAPRHMPAVIPAGFLLQYNNPEADAFAPPENQVVVGPSNISTPNNAGLAAMATSLWGTLIDSWVAEKLLTRKTAAKSHKARRYAASAVIIAVLITLLLAISPVPSARIHSPAAGNAAPSRNASGTYTGNVVLKDRGTNPAISTSGTTGTGSTPATQLIDSTIIGGQGSGTTSGATQPITSTVTGVTSPITGGSGGGSITPTTTGILGVTQPTTVTVPSTSVGTGDKSLLSTSPIAVTLN